MGSYSPEKLAWATLIVAFSIFITLSAAGVFVGQWFLFESTVPLQSVIKVGRGTVGITALNAPTSQEAVRINRTLGRGNLITTDEIAEGYIEFVDSRDSNRVIANAAILPGSQVKLIGATRPRFSFGENIYSIHLGDFEGRLEIEIPPQLTHDIKLVINGTHGKITLTESGFYLLWSLADSMTLIPRIGNATFQPYNGTAVTVPAGQTAEILALQPGVQVTKTTDELIKNPLFFNSAEAGVADNWGCYSLSAEAEAPRGSSTLLTLEGRRTIHIQRKGNSLGYGETGCRQFLGESPEGLDVTPYRTLRIRATLNIRWHSLAICGTQGSECPVMLELTYLNEGGAEQRWIHGFYSFEHVNPEVPRTCSSCLSDHDRITPGNWYTYESGNLFQLPEGFRPTQITQIRFYASGHEYEVLVGEVSLLGEY